MRELKLARYNIYEDDPGSYRWIDPEGVYSRFKLIYKEPGKRIYFGSGYYAGRLTPRIDGSAIIVFLYRQVTVGDKSYMQSEIYGYIQVDNILFSTLAKVLRPILPLVVRKRMGNLINVTRTLSEWIAEDPTEVYHLLARSKHITPRELADFKQRFVVKKK